MMMAMTGAPVAAARNAPIPTKPNVPGCSPQSGSSAWQASPNKNPIAAPVNKVGVKTPPTAPEPKVAPVANNLHTNTIASACHVDGWLMISNTKLLPLPVTSGR